jgi:hypothetical protein
MIRRRASRWRTVLALLPVLIVAASLPARALMRCRFDGTLRDACCCPVDDASGPSAPSVAEARCCERVMGEASRTPVVSSRSAEPAVDAASPVLLVLVAPAAPEPPRAPPGLARGRPLLPRPPLLVLKQTFLI